MIDTDTRGVSDPVDGAGPHSRAAGGVAHAPSLLRHLHSGAQRAAQIAARPHRGAGAKIAMSKELRRLASGDVSAPRNSRSQSAVGEGGPTAHRSSVSLLGPHVTVIT